MNKLADKQIRSALKDFLTQSSPQAILEEVRVHNGNAIADIVTIDSIAHCYEIKGESDEIRRISRQGSYYDLAFVMTTLVTTQNHMRVALEMAPPHWGLILASNIDGEVAFERIRSADTSPDFDKRLALLTLWRSELLSLCDSSEVDVKKLSREKLALKIADERPLYDITFHIGDLLMKRQTNKGWSLTM
jgi:hypothetical protein